MAVVLPKTISTSLISLVVSITIVSVAIVLNLYLPLISEFLTSGLLPLFWVSLKSWLTPPYLYVVINFIILTIAASSRFQQKIDQHMESIVPEALVKIQQDFVVPMVCDDKSVMVKSPVELRQEVGGVVGYGDDFVVMKSPVELRQEVGSTVIGYEVSMKNRMMSVEPELVPEVFEVDKKVEVFEVDKKVEVSIAAEKDEEVVTTRDIEMPSRTESMEILLDYSFSKKKPPVYARFGHRKLAKASPEGNIFS
ncbi:Cotton fiber expressed protein [Thalictrum thalictroides]|uniref:Cotton fiber expressed protein n=1 Tax=Thalictrum thalictroides TaxID=46969 RepID=A0A7J6WTK6_THATH|nr:Cotton fiber expressed protein [Thalictrum thalictroides]